MSSLLFSSFALWGVVCATSGTTPSSAHTHVVYIILTLQLRCSRMIYQRFISQRAWFQSLKTRRHLAQHQTCQKCHCFDFFCCSRCWMTCWRSCPISRICTWADCPDLCWPYAGRRTSCSGRSWACMRHCTFAIWLCHAGNRCCTTQAMRAYSPTKYLPSE